MLYKQIENQRTPCYHYSFVMMRRMMKMMMSKKMYIPDNN